jgi:hypothetical protein
MARLMVVHSKLWFFLSIAILTSCVGRIDTYYDSIFLVENGKLVNAHKTTIDVPNSGGEIVTKVVFPWSPKITLSISEGSSWLNARIITSEGIEGTKELFQDNRLKDIDYYVATLIIEAKANASSTRSAILTLSCPFRDNICMAEISVSQR